MDRGRVPRMAASLARCASAFMVSRYMVNLARYVYLTFGGRSARLNCVHVLAVTAVVFHAYAILARVVGMPASSRQHPQKPLAGRHLPRPRHHNLVAGPIYELSVHGISLQSQPPNPSINPDGFQPPVISALAVKGFSSPHILQRSLANSGGYVAVLR